MLVQDFWLGIKRVRVVVRGCSDAFSLHGDPAGLSLFEVMQVIVALAHSEKIEMYTVSWGRPGGRMNCSGSDLPLRIK
jgi:hypothetical protein